MDDAEELERLAHHIRVKSDEGGALPITPVRSSGVSAHNDDVKKSTSVKGSHSHPFVCLIFGVILVIFGLFPCSYALGDPAGRVPQEVKNWPEVVGEVVHSRYRGGKSFSYDVTIRYRLSHRAYWFQEKEVTVDINSPRVKYDPSAPSHFYRIPVRAEGIGVFILGLFPLLIGLLFVYEGLNRVRVKDFSFKPIATVVMLLVSILLGWAEYAYYCNQNRWQSAPAPSRVATSDDPYTDHNL